MTGNIVEKLNHVIETNSEFRGILTMASKMSGTREAKEMYNMLSDYISKIDDILRDVRNDLSSS